MCLLYIIACFYIFNCTENDRVIVKLNFSQENIKYYSSNYKKSIKIVIS